MLPKLDVPLYNLTIPSSGKEVMYRPFLVKEQKIMLMAMESEDDNDIIRSIKQVIRNCVQDDDINPDTMPFFDIEYIFLKLRARSIGETVELKLKHTDESNECDHVTDVTVSIEDVEVSDYDKSKNAIQLTDKIGIVFRFPTLEDFKQIKDPDNMTSDDFFTLIKNCVSSVYDEENVYDIKEIDPKELDEFIESMDSHQLEKVRDFIVQRPTVTKEIKWTCEGCGKEDSFTVSGLIAFFTLFSLTNP